MSTLLRARVRIPLVTTPAPLINAMTIGHGVLFLPFFTTRDARHLRGVCRELRAGVTRDEFRVGRSHG